MENYIQITDYPNYGISPAGEVKNLKTKKILKPNINKRGYLYVNLYNNSIAKICKIHKLVAIVYLGHIPNGSKEIVDHINNNPLDNRLVNLQLTTIRHNSSKDKQRELPTCVYRSGKKYQSTIVINRKRICLGTFDTVEEASLAYQNKLATL